MDKEMMKGSVDILVLSVINRGDTYGYEIMKVLRQRSEDRYLMTQGTLYPSLKRLEKKGYLTSYWGDAPETGVNRKFYSITNSGKKILEEKIMSWNSITKLIQLCKEGIT
ncbi:PadR family transcriptional regulator [Shimazuella kribbensis]|uniref:PadR family transcriptional regulator n=1 Tax=Shimazuella kribbensis TaxID=139808 RepID=UPI00040C7571|nr:helix-turn-helix transcriptional regulator [Shimazuella kribbensis]